MRIWRILPVLLLLAVPPGLYADAALTGKIGTLGFGGELTLGVSEKANFRLVMNYVNFEVLVVDEAGELDTEFDWFTYGVLLDYHPFKTPFRLSAGLLVNDNTVDLDGDLTGPVDLDDVEWLLDDLDGGIEFDELAPYVGIGYGNAIGPEGRWHIAIDIGFMFQGEPDTEASAVSSIPVLQPFVDAALEAEVQELEEEFEDYEIYPVASIGLSYKF